MEKKEPLKFPLSLVVLDFVGTAMLGLGLAKIFSEFDVLPASMQFENYALVFIVLGVVLMLPYMFYLISKIREQSERKLFK